MEKQPVLLVATDIYKNYGNILVLKGVSLEVNKAEMVSIVGASGAGKSTLLTTLAGWIPAASGKILLNSVEIGYKDKKPIHA